MTIPQHIMDMDKKKYKSWSLKEKEKLTTLVNKYQDKNRINWEMVARHFPERTKQQIKSIYMNSVKLQYTVPNKHKEQVNENNDNPIDQCKYWSMLKKGKLNHYCTFYQFDWDFIQRTYYPQYTKEQVQEIYDLLNQDYEQYRKVAIIIQNWDQHSPLNIDKNTLQMMYNDAILLLFKQSQLDTLMLEEKPNFRLKVQSVEDLNYYLIENKDSYIGLHDLEFLDIGVLRVIQSKFDILKIYNNLLAYIGTKPSIIQE